MNLEVVGEAGIGRLRLRKHLGTGRARLGEEVGVGSHRFHLSGLLAHPDRQRRAPVAFPRESPVDIGFQKVSKPTVFDVLWQPVDPGVVGQHRLAKLARADKPALPRILDERIIVGPPAERVVVDILLLVNEQAAGPQVAGDVAVALLHEPSAPHRKSVGERAVGRDGVDECRPRTVGKAGLLGYEHGVVHLAEGRRDVDDAGAGVGGDEVGGDHPPRRRLAAAGLEQGRGRHARWSIAVEGRQVGTADERRAGEAVDRVKLFFHLLAERRGERFGNDVFRRVGYASLSEHDILEIGLHGGELIGGERPGRRRPGDEAAVRRRAAIVEQREGDIDTRVGHFLVALADFATGEGCAPLGPPPDDLVALIEEPAVEQFGQCPPHALHIRLVVGDIGVGEVDPEADPLGERLPLLHVAPDALLTLVDEGLHTIGLDLGLGVDAEFLAHFHFDRQAVGVPAGLPFAKVAPHRAVARVEVFDGSREAVAGMGHPVGGGRPFVEDEPVATPPAVE